MRGGGGGGGDGGTGRAGGVPRGGIVIGRPRRQAFIGRPSFQPSGMRCPGICDPLREGPGFGGLWGLGVRQRVRTKHLAAAFCKTTARQPHSSSA